MPATTGPTITDWIMVGITAVYVIATIFIFVANIKSANAAKKQLETSKNQFEETKRLECLPCFDINPEQGASGGFQEIDLTTQMGGLIITGGYNISISNIGKGIAKELKCEIITPSISSTIIIDIPLIPMQKDIICPIMFAADSNGFIDGIMKARISLSFDDLLDNHYIQFVDVQFISQQPQVLFEIERINSPTVQKSEESTDA